MTNNSKTGSVQLPSMLESIGLTANDSRVYLYLLENGQSVTGSKIAKVNKMHRQYVHNSLSKLEKLGLIEIFKEGRKHLCKALPPAQVTKLAQRKLLEAENIEKELKIISAVGAEQDFEVYYGEKQIRDFEQRIIHNLEEDTVQYIIGGSGDNFLNFFGEDYFEYAKIAKERRLRTYYIACREEASWLENVKKAHYFFEYVILDSLPRTVIATVIRFNAVTIHSVANPPLIYIIKSKRVADDYKKFFDMLWDMAKK